MPTRGVPGQQATPSAIRAMPVTRATVIATPVSSTPNSHCPTRDGAISKATPVAASLTAATISTVFGVSMSRPFTVRIWLSIAERD